MSYHVEHNCRWCNSPMPVKWSFGDYIQCPNCKRIHGTDYDDSNDLSIWIDMGAEPFNPRYDKLAIPEPSK